MSDAQKDLERREAATKALGSALDGARDMDALLGSKLARSQVMCVVPCALCSA